MPRLSILGVCGGNGVLLHPLKRYLVGNIEHRKVFFTTDKAQWYRNFSVPLVEDVKLAEYMFRDVDIIVGAPDCGHSSILRFTGSKKSKNPTENKSIRTFFESILTYKPKLWVMENLPALLNSITQSSFKEQFPDYRFIFHIVSMAEFGNSQKTRKRLVIIAIDRNLPADVFMEFSEITKQNKIMTVSELIGDLDKDNPINMNIREPGDKSVKMGNKSFTFLEIEEGWNNKKLKKKRYWPLDLKKKDSAYIPGVYRLLSNGYPQTVRQDPRQFRPDGKPLSPRELARIQGIPDGFILHRPEEKEFFDALYYINKARITVAKGAPYELGMWIAEKIKKTRKFLR